MRDRTGHFRSHRCGCCCKSLVRYTKAILNSVGVVLQFLNITHTPKCDLKRLIQTVRDRAAAIWRHALHSQQPVWVYFFGRDATEQCAPEPTRLAAPIPGRSQGQTPAGPTTPASSPASSPARSFRCRARGAFSSDATKSPPPPPRPPAPEPKPSAQTDVEPCPTPAR